MGFCRRDRLPPVLAVFAIGCGGATPISFVEVTGDRVPALQQDRFVPNDGFNNGLGAAVGDVDGDGRPDLYLASGGLFLNRPDPAGFRLEPAPGPPADATWLGAAFGDYDRDGDLDLALCGQGGVRLWQNDGGGGFIDVTAAAGVGGAADDVSLAVAWGDLDGDGWLDLAVGNYGFSRHANDQQTSRLWLNRRDGSFAASPALATDPVRAWVVTLADFDGDGHLDLHLGDDAAIAFLDTSLRRHDRVFLSRGVDANGPVLVESSAALGLDSPHATMGLAVGDAGHTPGWDLLIADIRAEWLYRGAGSYGDQTAATGIDLSGPSNEQWWQWGSVFADLDGDGWEDALVSQAEVLPRQAGAETVGPVLLRNQRGRFSMQRYAFGGPMNARAIVLADLDGDGDQDAIVAPFFDRFRVLDNQTRPRRFVRVRLVATVSAPGAAGALVTATSGGATQKRMRVAGGQPHSSSEEILDFGLGEASAADLTVLWPSGARQQVAAASGAVAVTEPAWLTLSDPRPPADGATTVTLTLDLGQAGLGGCNAAHLDGGGLALDAACQSGVARFTLPARSQPGALQCTLTVDGRELPAHPAIDWR